MEDTAAYTAATLTYKTWALLFYFLLCFLILYYLSFGCLSFFGLLVSFVGGGVVFMRLLRVGVFLKKTLKE